METEKRIPLILVADDVPKNLQLLGNILRDEIASELAFATNGSQVLSFVNKIRPDLILLDVMMPEMDGFETCRQLKMNEDTKDIPVIFLTARVDTEDIVKGFRLGAVDYVTKPFESVELVARVRTHLAIKQMRDDLVELNNTKDKFFSIISHDLKNPMGAILTLAEILSTRFDTFTAERQNVLIQTMYESAKASFNLLDNLLVWSRAQRGKLAFEPQKFEVETTISGVLQLLRQSADKKSIRLVNEVDPSLQVYADRNMLETVIRNLVSNGIKFTRENGEIQVSSRLLSNGEGQLAEIAVKDSGIGIPADKTKQIFRIDNTYSTPGTNDEPGTGLGLVLCAEFMRINGGAIRVESQEGSGSTFICTFPLA